VLNATYEPINVTAVRRAMVLMLKAWPRRKDCTIGSHSASHAHRVPSVIRLLAYRTFRTEPGAFAENILHAATGIRASSAGVFPSSELTLDHVVPRSRGGRSSWENWWLAATAATTGRATGHPKRPA